MNPREYDDEPVADCCPDIDPETLSDPGPDGYIDDEYDEDRL